MKAGPELSTNPDSMSGKAGDGLVQIRTSAPGDYAAVKQRLQKAEAPEFWRSLEELAGTPEFEEMLHREFPRQAGVLDEVSRRNFLKLMSASLALAGLTGCTKLPIEPIVPFVRQPEEMILGKPLFFATAMDFGGYAEPLLVRSNEGRPTKIEGNPEHPVSQGATSVFAQGSILDLYDPDRSQTTTYLGEVRPYASFIGAMQGPISSQKALKGAGFRLLTGPISSPSLAAQIRTLQQNFPQMRWHQWLPVNRDSWLEGSKMAFGAPVEVQYHLENADVVVSLDANFLYPGFPGFTRIAREWAKRHQPDSPKGLNRTYAIESTPTPTGFKAEHRLPVRASQVEQYARALASRLGVNAGGGNVAPEHAAWLDALAKDLQAHRGACVIIPGEQASAVVHVLAHAMNEALDAAGKTVAYTDPVLYQPEDNHDSLRALAQDINAGKVDLLLMLGGNPVYDCPVDADLTGILGKVPLRIHHGIYQNETTVYSHWHVNAAHYLESWTDLRAANGMVSIAQPLIAPLYGGRSAHEVLAIFNGQPETSGYELIRAYWQSQYKGTDFELFWRRAVHDGFMGGTEYQPRAMKVKAGAIPAAANEPAPQGLEVHFYPDPSVWDGRYANNGFLQECPKPLTKLTWENPVWMSPATAKQLKLDWVTQDTAIVTLEHNGRKVDVPVWIQPGQPDGQLSFFLGGGRTRSGRTGDNKGVSAYQIKFFDDRTIARDVKLTDTGQKYVVASTQGYQAIESRNLIRMATLETFQKNPGFAHLNNFAPPRSETMYPNYQYNEYAWGMQIDLNACVGCNSCVIACVTENNIPVVGKEQVLMGRKMHWLRIDNFFQGDPENPRMWFQPTPCMHCEDAPCELVCPVNATVHSSEGLNEMIYNRCVGTRYCSNNCPWKVRRFNFLLFQDWNTPQLKMMRNPEVTVRSRGVMEKCSYCVQRITAGRIASEEADRRVRDMEILTACQQACPTNAIVFGDINDPNSAVAKLKAGPRTYATLEELNTRPRTTYTAAVIDPNPEMPQALTQQQPEQHY